MADNNSDVVRDILMEAYIEILGRALISSNELEELKTFISDFTDRSIELKPLEPDQKFVVDNKEYLGYVWKNEKELSDHICNL